jgi:hypothetical protein
MGGRVSPGCNSGFRTFIKIAGRRRFFFSSSCLASCTPVVVVIVDL